MLSFDNGIASSGEWCDGKDPSISLAYDHSVYCYCFLNVKYMFLRPWDHETPGYRRNTLCAIKFHKNMLYKYHWRCLLSWRESRLWFVTPCFEEVSLGPLGNTHHKKLASEVTKDLIERWCMTERVKRLAGNEIELDIEIPTIESRASNIPTDKGNYVCCHKGSTDKRSSWNM